MGIAAIVLAAGKGERMGKPKAHVPFGGGTFLSTALVSLTKAGFSPIVVVIAPGDTEAKRVAEEHGAAAVENPKPERGMLSSIRHGLTATGDATHAAILPVDHPGIADKTFQALLLHARNQPDKIVVPSHGGRRGHPGIFPRAVFPELMGAPEDEGAVAVLHAKPERIVHVVVDDEACVKDKDTPADLQ